MPKKAGAEVMLHPDIEEPELVRLLKKCEPGRMSEALFHQFCRLLPMIAIEVVTLRRAASRTIEVLLTQRPANDPYFPNEWHSPGTILRVTDFEGITPKEPRGQVEQFNPAFERLAKTELGQIPNDLQFAGMLMMPSPRGPHLHLVFVNRVPDDYQPEQGTFFDTEELPEPLMAAHQPVIDEAIRKFIFLEREAKAG